MSAKQTTILTIIIDNYLHLSIFRNFHLTAWDTYEIIISFHLQTGISTAILHHQQQANITKLVFVVCSRGRSQPMTNFSEAAYINRQRKQYSISTAGPLQFFCINGITICLYEGMTHRQLNILLYNFIPTCSQPSSMQLQSIISHHRRDIEINKIFQQSAQYNKWLYSETVVTNYIF